MTVSTSNDGGESTNRPRAAALIGVGGYATAGKDALADFLEERGFSRTTMSAPMVEALTLLDPFIPLDDGSSVRFTDLVADRGLVETKKLPEVRRLLQVMGTEVGRNMFGQDVWVDAMTQRIDPSVDTVITGIRISNEARAITSRGGLLVWVNRPGVGPVNGHESEVTLGQADFDVVVENDGTLNDLRARAHELLTLSPALNRLGAPGATIVGATRKGLSWSVDDVLTDGGQPLSPFGVSASAVAPCTRDSRQGAAHETGSREA